MEKKECFTVSHNAECRLSVDTIYLVAKTNTQDRQLIKDRFHLPKNRLDKFYHYSLNQTNELGFTIHSMPRNTFTYSHYDHQLQIQRKITVDREISQSLLEVIDGIDWQIRRLDLAFDLKTPKEKSMMFKHHASVKLGLDDKWQTEYMTKLQTRSTSMIASYERNVKEKDYNTNVTHLYDNRYEVRLYPRCNDETMKLHTFQDDFIVKHLSKYIIVENIDELPISKWDKNRLYKIKEDYSYLKTLPTKKQRELRSICKAHRLPLEQIYLESKPNLFKFLNEPSASPQDVPIPMHQVL